jgi:hypothetical protein
MKPINLKEYAENLLRTGTAQEGDFAREILQNIQAAEDLDEANAWIEDVTKFVPDEVVNISGDKVLEWIGDQLHMIDEMKERLKKSGFSDPAYSLDEQIDFALNDYDDAEGALERSGFAEGSLTDKVMAALQKIPEPLEYDL